MVRRQLQGQTVKVVQLSSAAKRRLLGVAMTVSLLPMGLMEKDARKRNNQCPVSRHHMGVALMDQSLRKVLKILYERGWPSLVY